MTAAVLVAAAITVLAWLLRRRVLVVTVDGESMLPSYRPGDRLLVRRAALARVRRGDVVVLRAPGLSRPLPVPPSRPGLFLKRAAALPGDAVPPGIPVPDAVVPPRRLVVLGDNTGGSFDSRSSGYYADADVIGVVVRRLTDRTHGQE